MDIHFCTNNIAIISQPLKDNPFCGIELWFHFGASNDPQGMSGIAHFLEHLMSSAVSKVDPYFYHKMSSSTSKDRIRIGGTIGMRHANEILERILDCLFNLKVDEFYFNYQKQKVIYEILYLNKAPILEYIESFETVISNGNGYEKSTFGLEKDIMNIEYDTMKEYLSGNLYRGITISLTGSFDVQRVVKYVETVVQIKCNALLTEPQALDVRDYSMSGKHNGIMFVYDTSVIGCNTDVSLVNDYLIFALSDFPIGIKNINYKNNKAVCIYIPDNKQYFEQFIKKTSFIDVDTFFPIIREYQLDCLLEIMNSPSQYALANVESYYYKIHESIESRMNKIQETSPDQFKDVISNFFLMNPIRIISENNQHLYKMN